LPLFNEQFLVIDYGTTRIKGVLCENGPGGRRVLRLESLPIVLLENADLGEEEDSGALADLTEYEYNVTRFVQSFFPEESNYLLNLSLDRVYVRDLVIPIVNAKQINEVIPHEVENYLPVSLDEAEVIGKAWEIGDESSQVITFTAPNESLVQRVQPLLRGTTSVRMLSLDAVGLANFIQLLDPTEYQDRVVGQIDIGGSLTILNILKDGELVFSRQLPIGGRDLDYIIAEEYNVDVDMAETIKLGLACVRKKPSNSINATRSTRRLTKSS
jgi:general secretion pathway protein L